MTDCGHKNKASRAETRARHEKWLRDNREAIKAYNREFNKQGVFGNDFRSCPAAYGSMNCRLIQAVKAY